MSEDNTTVETELATDLGAAERSTAHESSRTSMVVSGVE